LCVLAVFRASNAAGEAGELSVRIVRHPTGQIIFRSRPRRVRFVNDPDDTSGVVFRIRSCSFPTAGLYWVELLFSGTVLARQRLSVRS
jgi:hypothetical protein